MQQHLTLRNISDKISISSIQTRRTVLIVLYWLTLENGTGDILLNKAFNTIKQGHIHGYKLYNIHYG